MKSEIEKIKSLRDSTGLSLNEIKKALNKTGGDEKKAKEILHKLGISVAAKKASREVKEGVVEAYVHNTRKIGAMIELACETDFVAKNSEFQQLAKEVAMHVTAMKPKDVKELLTQPFIRNPEITIQELISQSIAKLGENIQLSRFEIFEI